MTEIVAACEINWNTLEEAKEMIRQSKLAGASYTKFQLYSENEIKDDPTHIRAHERKIMLTKDTAKELFDYGKEIGQNVFFSVMYEEAVDICEEIGVELYKIRFADCYNYDLIYKVLSTHKEVFMSIDLGYRAMEFRHNSRITFLYVVPKYPAQPEDYKLEKSMFNYFSGISDHTKGLVVAKKALSLGANIIEKHCMLSGTHPVEEKWSISFDKLKELNPHNHYRISSEKIEEGEKRGRANVKR